VAKTPAEPTGPGVIVRGHEHKAASQETCEGAADRRSKERAAIAQRRAAQLSGIADLSAFDNTEAGARLSEAVAERGRRATMSDSHPREPIELRAFIEAAAEYWKAVAAAIHAGLLDHPAVVEWLASRRSLRDRAALRKFKNKLRLERGIGQNLADEAEIWIAVMAAGVPEIKDGSRISIVKLRRRLLALVGKPPDWFRPTPDLANAIRRRIDSPKSLRAALRRLD
jgi:hypothetical protein